MNSFTAKMASLQVSNNEVYFWHLKLTKQTFSTTKSLHIFALGIDKCRLGTDGCGENASCNNIDGLVECHCNPGYVREVEEQFCKGEYQKWECLIHNLIVCTLFNFDLPCKISKSLSNI